MEKTLVIIAALAALAAASLGGCATTDDDKDPNCVRYEHRPETYGGQTFDHEMCVEWMFGPTRQQREEFDRRARGWQ